MDCLYRGYTCWAKLWNNSGQLALIRWFPAEKGAKFFTDRHRFASLYNDRGPSDPYQPGQPDPLRLGDNPSPNDGVGEAGDGFSTAALPRLTSDAGNIHGLTGQTICRADLMFTGGTLGVDAPLTLDADGVPTCCQRAEQWKGGEREGGLWPDYASGKAGPWAGGTREGGFWSDSLPAKEPWIGGDREGGLWPDLEVLTDLWLGGDREGGLWSAVVSLADVWTGGEREGGTWPDNLKSLDVYQGGERNGGSWADVVKSADTWQGGQAEGGTWSGGYGVKESWAGGTREGGGWPDTEVIYVLEHWLGGVRAGGLFLDLVAVRDVWAGGDRAGGLFLDLVAVRDVWAGGDRGGGLWADLVAIFDVWQGGDREGGWWTDTTVKDVWAGGDREGGEFKDALPGQAPTAGAVAQGTSSITVVPPTGASGDTWYLVVASNDQGNVPAVTASAGWTLEQSEAVGSTRTNLLSLFRWTGTGAPGNATVTGHASSTNLIGVILDCGANAEFATCKNTGTATTIATCAFNLTAQHQCALWAVSDFGTATITWTTGTQLVAYVAQGSIPNLCNLTVGYKAPSGTGASVSASVNLNTSAAYASVGAVVG